MNTIRANPFGKAFERPAFISYLVAGDPSPSESIAIARALIDGGADIIELGLPFSDPVGDGPVIQRGDTRSLAAGFVTQDIFSIAAGIRQHADIPVIIMTYLNPVLAAGIDDFYRSARESGVDGILIVDMPVEESDIIADAARRHDLAQIFLISTTTSNRRIADILEASARINIAQDADGAITRKGFVYLVSSPGVTGARDMISGNAFELIAKVRAIADQKKIRLPLAVGFGISTRRQAEEMRGAGADGVIVGSAIVRMTEEHSHDMSLLTGMLKEYAREMKENG